jgi:hypothetical protein
MVVPESLDLYLNLRIYQATLDLVQAYLKVLVYWLLRWVVVVGAGAISLVVQVVPVAVVVISNLAVVEMAFKDSQVAQPRPHVIAVAVAAEQHRPEELDLLQLETEAVRVALGTLGDLLAAPMRAVAGAVPIH